MGDKVGDGDNGDVYRLGGSFSNLAIKVVRPGIDLRDELHAYEALRRCGIKCAAPTDQYKGPVQWKHKGKSFEGLLLKYIDNAVPLEFHTVELCESLKPIVTPETAKGIRDIREKLMANRICFDQLEILISRDDGSVTAIDPDCMFRDVDYENPNHQDVTLNGEPLPLKSDWVFYESVELTKNGVLIMADEIEKHCGQRDKQQVSK